MTKIRLRWINHASVWLLVSVHESTTRHTSPSGETGLRKTSTTGSVHAKVSEATSSLGGRMPRGMRWAAEIRFRGGGPTLYFATADKARAWAARWYERHSEAAALFEIAKEKGKR